MRLRAFALAAAAAASVVVCAASAAGAADADGAAPHPAATAAAGWGGAEAVPGVSALGGGTALIQRLSCPAAGDCTAIGDLSTLDSDGDPIYVGFLVSQSGGTWGNAELIPGLPSDTFESVNALSCAAPGDCVVGGYYQAGSALGDDQAFIVVENGGKWGNAEIVPGVTTLEGSDGSSLGGLSCTAPGDCAASGYAGNDAFVINEKNSAWGSAIPVASSSAGASLLTVACASTGNCAAGGLAGDTAIVANETNGSWAAAKPIANTDVGAGPYADAVSAISCRSAGNCVAVGGDGAYLSAPKVTDFIAQESDGTWGAAQPVPGLAALNTGTNTQGFLGLPGDPDISCGAVGDCAITGGYLDGGDVFRGFVDSESGGTWGGAEEIPGTGGNGGGTEANGVSCAAAGTCSVTGITSSGIGNDQAFTLDEAGGMWGAAQPIPGTGTQSEGFGVTCISSGYCTVGGVNGNAAFIAVKPLSATATSLELSAAKATYGDEQAVKVTVTVTSSAGTPGGAVTLKDGGTKVATLALSSGKATYTLSGTALAPGTAKLTASYGGNTGYGDSVSGAGTLSVGKAGSKTALSLSEGAVTYGKETLEKITVTVSPQYAGTPGGTVTVKADNTMLVTLTLKSGKATYTLTASKLRAGTYKLTAAYGGSADYSGSASLSRTLTVKK
jgi:hypothetical protein